MIRILAYGWTGVLEAWIVDLEGERIERHTEPVVGGYRPRALAQLGETLASAMLPSVEFDADAVLGDSLGRTEVSES